LKKQSQFSGGVNLRKVLYERILWQNNALQGTKKQSQFIRSEFSVLRAARTNLKKQSQLDWIPACGPVAKDEFASSLRSSQ